MKPDFTDKPFQNFHTEYTAVIPPENFNSAINSMPGFDPFLRGPYSTMFVLQPWTCLLYTSPSPRDRTRSRMPSSA